MQDDASLWKWALEGSDSLAVAALDRFCMSFGSVAGALAPAHGASALVIAGGVGQRLADRMPDPGFRHRFTAKGRSAKRMADIPVKLMPHPRTALHSAAGALREQTQGRNHPDTSDNPSSPPGAPRKAGSH